MRLLCEVKLQSDNDKYHDFIYIRNLKNQPNQTKLIDTENREVVQSGRGPKGGGGDVRVVSGMVMVAN